MPIPFSTIPEHILMSIAPKLSLEDFSKLQESSRLSFDISRKSGARPSLSLKYCSFYSDDSFKLSFWNDNYIDIGRPSLLPFRLIVHKMQFFVPLTENLCEALINFILETPTSVNTLLLKEQVKCSPELFRKLLDVTRTQKVSSFCSWSAEFRQLPIVSSLKSIRWSSPLTDEDIVSIKLPKLSLRDTQISAFGINYLIKEWIDGKRDFDEICVRTERELRMDAICDGISPSLLKLSRVYEKLREIKQYCKIVRPDSRRKTITLINHFVTYTVEIK